MRGAAIPAVAGGDGTSRARLGLALRFGRAGRQEFFTHQSRYAVCQGQNAVPRTDVSQVLRSIFRRRRNWRTVCRYFGEERYGWVPDLRRIEIQGIGAGADRSRAFHRGAGLGRATEEAAERALPESLVCGGEG